jgi:hypothetical protein
LFALGVTLLPFCHQVGGGYTVILTTVEGKQTGDEISLSSGIMEISNGNYKLILKIHGEGGC